MLSVADASCLAYGADAAGSVSEACGDCVCCGPGAAWTYAC